MNRRAMVMLAGVGLAVAISGQQAHDAGVSIARAAEAQVGVTTIYDPSYVRLAYPGGDVPLERGVCSDVVVRAFRAIDVDLQVEVHDDMRRHFDEYPDRWGLRSTDRSIDHRRVPNLMTFFVRQGKSVGDEAWREGDVVAWRLPNGLHHIGIVSTIQVPESDRPFVVHNIGLGAELEDLIGQLEVIGHYRWGMR